MVIFSKFALFSYLCPCSGSCHHLWAPELHKSLWMLRWALQPWTDLKDRKQTKMWQRTVKRSSTHVYRFLFETASLFARWYQSVRMTRVSIFFLWDQRTGEKGSHLFLYGGPLPRWGFLWSPGSLWQWCWRSTSWETQRGRRCCDWHHHHH